MTTMVDGYVPVIDLSSGTREELASAIGGACATSGFYVIVGHGIPRELVARMYAVTTEFFTLPVEEKDRAGGFRRSGGTTAQSLDQQSPPDLCESFGAHVTALADGWPDAPAAFRETWLEYLTAVESLAHDLLRLSARALGSAEDFYDDKFDRHTSSLVANFYYPQHGAPLPGQLRRGAHTDFGGLTVLYQEDDLSGLQVRHGENEWRDVRAIPGSFVVNIGDLLARWTGGRWVSTLHRVVNPAPGDTSSRLSVPFFYQPNHDAVVDSVVAGEWIATKMRKLFAPR
ncbi:isopenicillin N synthase family oxygenase [Amycolatopsis sp. YIM 10]|uniref:isopenicillin N synthase family dioxygenase n=1 Tax=Amycolatopsis sp. YIM 10 TaxID=2653857 RepID=UPI00129077E2|nr:2OG-Fe(II) oxygenase family protein [Amycolatopsis sp. YIM 10]QFU87213.1 2-oxoglutarate-dependent ethylene/succinate-forming enzyme [Amycolatopsis sp. YIM 10]